MIHDPISWKQTICKRLAPEEVVNGAAPMTLSPAEIYDTPFYSKHRPWKRDYFEIAHALVRVLNFDSVLDLGCGNAYILEQLQKLGKTITAVDGSSFALDSMSPEVRQRAQIHDLRFPVDLGHFDCVICTEVAEHLPSEFADTLVKSICVHGPRNIFFTAAIPGQKGRYHVNLQPQEYWVEKFSCHGYGFNQLLTQNLQDILDPIMINARWIKRNTMIFCSMLSI
jgi:SAM-dependent methyltransferase